MVSLQRSLARGEQIDIPVTKKVVATLDGFPQVTKEGLEVVVLLKVGLELALAIYMHLKPLESLISSMIISLRNI